MPRTVKVYVVGVGMTKFEKPGKEDGADYPEMAKEAVTKALKDAGVSYDSIKAACVGYVFGDSTCGQRALYEVGLNGCPIYNVNNNCSTGSTALLMAKQIIEAGSADCVLALGFEKMERGPLLTQYSNRTNPMEKHIGLLAEIAGKIIETMYSDAKKRLLQLSLLFYMPNFRTKRESNYCPTVRKCWIRTHEEVRHKT